MKDEKVNHILTHVEIKMAQKLCQYYLWHINCVTYGEMTHILCHA